MQLNVYILIIKYEVSDQIRYVTENDPENQSFYFCVTSVTFGTQPVTGHIATTFFDYPVRLVGISIKTI